MKRYLINLITGVVALICLMRLTAAAQAAPSAPDVATLSAEQLDQLTAPIALYPDPLIAQILMAATYPLEVVEADRWLQDPAHAALGADALPAALQGVGWDPSVKSLVPFPQIPHMMDTNLQWTEQIGDAFLAQQADVMDSVQRLRKQAQAAGSLASSTQQTVEDADDSIMIEPADSSELYVPYYDPNAAYGSWPWPDYPPYYFPPPPGFFYGGALIGFGLGIAIGGPLWGWHHWDWHHHRLNIDAGRFNPINGSHPPVRSGPWQHDPGHRAGIPYRDAGTSERFLGGGGSAGSGRALRGFMPAPATIPQMTRQPQLGGHVPAAVGRSYGSYGHGPAQRSTILPGFESFPRGAQVRSDAARGFSSRSMSAPASRVGGGGGGGGGQRR
jgi:hypothetical protein